jgi:hypothetical protein
MATGHCQFLPMPDEKMPLDFHRAALLFEM